VNTFVTATSLLPNGNLGILEVRIFNPERTGIFGEFLHLGVNFSGRGLCVELPGSRYYLYFFLNRRPPSMFLSAVLGFILYTLVFLRMRGNIVASGLYIRLRLARNENWGGRLFAQSYAIWIAGQMLLYVCHPCQEI
jgi:hypothetical protein